MNYVVDASVAVKWYVSEVFSSEAERLLAPAHELHAPDLIVPEFGNIVWKKIRLGELTAPQGRKIINAFLDLPLLKHPNSQLLLPAFEGALQSAQTVYDWTYLALAVALNLELVTADEKFYHALAHGSLARHLCWVTDIP
jgi:predicted nucleic acid-binding protein